MKIPQTKRYSIYKKLVFQDERSKKLNFEPDGREHYVYRITDYTRSEKEHYYGSHTPEKGKKYNSLIEEFWTYKTSSNYNLLNENKKEQYKIKIIKVFNNPADKIIYEAFLHQYFDVKSHSKFWNKSNQTPFGYDTTGKSFNVGRKQTLKVKMAISKANSNFVSSNIGRVNKEQFDKDRKIFGVMKNYKHVIKYNKKYVVTKSSMRMLQEDFYNSNEVGLMKNVFCGLDKNGNKVKLEKDEKFNKNEYIGHHKNKVVVKDKNGNKFHVEKDDPRYLSGELVGHTKGMVAVKDKEGNKFNISIHDPRYLSGELVNINKGSMPKPHNIKIIEIFDNEDRLIYSVDEGFQNFCKKNNLPYNSFRQSYINGTKLGERNRETSSLTNKGFEVYLGWYAKIK